MREVFCPICGTTYYIDGRGRLTISCPFCVSKLFGTSEEDKSTFEQWGDGSDYTNIDYDN